MMLSATSSSLRLSSVISPSSSSRVECRSVSTSSPVVRTSSHRASFLSGARNGKGLRSSSRSCSGGDRRRRGLPSVRAGIRAVESYDASFQLQPEADETLRNALSSPVFCVQVAEQSQKGADVRYEFTGLLFQPVPWSPTTKFGMPVEFEGYLQDKENYAIINVPPNFMFNAKIFKPSRLCAVFKRI